MQLPVGNSGILTRFIPLPNNRGFVSAGFEVPAALLSVVLLESTLGRRASTTGFYFFGGVCCAAIAASRDAAFDAMPAEALALMRDRDTERATRWRARFALSEPAA